MELEKKNNRGKDFSAFERGFIKALLKNAFKPADIKNQLSEEGFERSESSIRNFHKKMIIGQTLSPQRQKCKRPNLIGIETGEKLKNAIIEDPTLSGRQLIFDDDINSKGLSQCTINRFLSNEVGFKVRKMQNLKKISNKNIEKRLDFGLKHKDGSVDDGNKILFSDESYLFACKQGPKLYRVLDSEEVEDEKIFDKNDDEKHKILFGGCISGDGVVDLVWIHENVNQIIYEEEILESHVKTFKFLENEGIFQQDNAPPHTAQKTLKGFQENNVDTLEGPPQSPDLSPIENIWAFLKDQIGKTNKKEKIASKDDVWRICQDAWFSGQSEELIKGCYKSLPNRMSLLIQNKGKHIPY